MDNSYRSFLYRYIQNEFENFQIIILTHSTSFFNLCEHWINENNKGDKWLIQGIYEYGGKHKVYTKGRLNSDTIKKRLDENINITILGNETRQLFEMLVHQFSMLTMIGAKEEASRLIEEIYKNEKKRYFCVTDQRIRISTDLLDEIRGYIKNYPIDKQLTKIKDAIIEFDKGKSDRLSSWLDEMKMYQKSTLHQASHGHTGLPDISSSEIKASLQVLSRLESAIKNIKIGRIQM